MCFLYPRHTAAPREDGKKVMAGEGVIDCINALHKSWNIFIKAHTLLPFLYS